MRIGQRLALRFTFVSALLTGVILILIFNVARKNVHRDFIERLVKQSSLEVLHYATPHVRDVIPPGAFLLINPITSIYDESGELLHGSADSTHARLARTSIGEEPVEVERGDYTTVGRKYSIGGQTYQVFVSDKDLPGQNELDIFLRAIVLGWLLSIGLSYGTGLYFASNALKPVIKVVHEVNHVTKDNLGYRLSLPVNSKNPDELEELVITFNALLNRIETAFDAQRRFVQHASHEIKTPITAIMGEAELALVRDRTPEEYKRTLSVVVGETERLVNITQGLLTLARFEEGYYNSELENVAMGELIRSAVGTFAARYPDRKLLYEEPPGELLVHGNMQLLQVAINNLVDNGFKYSDKDVRVIVSANGGAILIRIIDSGIGIPQTDLMKVTSPMYRGTNVKNIPGAGLGLSLVQRIIEFHGGKLTIESKENTGTTTALSLPQIRGK